MGFFSNSIFKPKRSFALVLHLDVGRGNCRVALISDDHDREMVYTSLGTEKISLGPHRRNLLVTVSSLRDVLDDVSKFIELKVEEGKYFDIDKIYVILAAPYYLSHTANIKYKEEKSFTVTPELVASLLKDYRKGNDSPSESHEDAKVGTIPKILTERIVAIKVNGYHTATPYGKKANSIEVSVFRTETAPEVVSAVSREVGKHFSAPIYFEPLSLAIYVSLRDHVHFDKDFIFVVVGVEVTEVSLVRNFTLLETVSLPFGKHSLVRHLSREISTPEEMVLSRISVYSQSEGLLSEKNEMENALLTGGKKWFPFFERALASLSDVSTLPSSVYLVADSQAREIFRKFIQTDSWSGQTIAPSGLLVTTVDAELVKTLMKFGKEASCDTLLCLEGLFAVSTKLPVNISD